MDGSSWVADLTWLPSEGTMIFLVVGSGHAHRLELEPSALDFHLLNAFGFRRDLFHVEA